MFRWLTFSLAIVILDQITKFLAVQFLVLHEPTYIYNGLNFTLMYNTGAAFSFLSDAGGWQRWFFIGVSCLVSIIIVVWMYNTLTKIKNQCLLFALSFILGGAIGNLWDRLTLGYVVDFIEVYYENLYWPAFNIADSSITIGAILMILDTLLIDRAKNKL
jgi:signal peptidase II|tara:strand:+ start:1146 stop:1625 length:480 start_codon:yes stop_codon:yes gene_type:complete